jgi:ABC-type Fe3+-hydroxamate transport system substrate-binding protein
VRLRAALLGALVWVAGCAAPAPPPAPPTSAPVASPTSAPATPLAAVSPTAAPPTSAPVAPPTSAPAAPTPGAGGQGHVVTDMTNRTVTMPPQVNRIAEEWSAHAIIVEMLGAGSKLVAVNQGIQPPAMPFLQQVDPRLATLSSRQRFHPPKS